MASKDPQLLIGWLTLPEELKVEVLRNTLPRNLTYNARIFNAHSPSPERRDTDGPLMEAEIYKEVVIPLLSISEIRHLVLQVFYAQNTMEVKHGELRGAYPNLRTRTAIPPVHIRHLVRYLEIDIRRVDHGAIGFLGRLAAPALGFAGLHHLKLIFRSIPVSMTAASKAIHQHLESVNTIAFQTKLLEAEYRHNPHFEWHRRRGLYPNKDGFELLEIPLLNKLSIQRNSVRTNAEPREEWLRYFDDDLHGCEEREYVGAWLPPIQANMPPEIYKTRVTRKIVRALSTGYTEGDKGTVRRLTQMLAE
ncbi:hypothetical protein BDU57DRAFT_568163 [Ampelomyces quisqualis]|uniref:Uncharacterized protein n=1 Tax=Ampelomyces quisqualis TaxID=50730 RepID=A0A6A5QZ16_AMPQU|nr:hypothetical protein BDU57DRAFT_568163 [Ampelomyces quisqualis]